MSHLKLSIFLTLGLVSYALCYLFFWATAWFILYSLFRTIPRNYAHVAGILAIFTATLSAYNLLKQARTFYTPDESPLISTGRHETAASLLFQHYGNRVTGTAYILGQLLLAGPFCFIKAASYLKVKAPTQSV